MFKLNINTEHSTADAHTNQLVPSIPPLCTNGIMNRISWLMYLRIAFDDCPKDKKEPLLGAPKSQLISSIKAKKNSFPLKDPAIYYKQSTEIAYSVSQIISSIEMFPKQVISWDNMMDIVSSIQNNCAANKTTTEVYDKTPKASFMKSEGENEEEKKEEDKQSSIKNEKTYIEFPNKNTDSPKIEKSRDGTLIIDLSNETPFGQYNTIMGSKHISDNLKGYIQRCSKKNYKDELSSGQLAIDKDINTANAKVSSLPQSDVSSQFKDISILPTPKESNAKIVNEQKVDDSTVLLDLSPDYEEEVLKEFPSIKVLEQQFNADKIKGICVCGNCICTLKNIAFPINLIVLNVAYNNLFSMDGIDKCANLKFLNFSFNCVNSIKGLKPLVKLVEVVADGNHITNTVDLTKLQMLSVLDLSNNKIKTYEEIAPLSCLKSLRYLKIERNPICVKSGFSEIIKRIIPKENVIYKDDIKKISVFIVVSSIAFKCKDYKASIKKLPPKNKM